MNFKALLLGATIGLAIAVAPSCGGSVCGPSNCGGCCTTAGACIGRDIVNDSACGSQGVSCASCVSTGQTCNKTTYACAGAIMVADSGMGGGTGAIDSGTKVDAGTDTTGTKVDAGTGTTGTPVACNFVSPVCSAGTECLLADQQGNALCFPGECDVVKQDCPGGARCGYGQLVDGGLGRTCAAPGPQAEGAACGGANGDNCTKGLLCVNGICAKYCNNSQNCTTGSLCQVLVTIPGVAEKPLVCRAVESCNPLVQTCSKGAESCYPTSAGALCETTGTVAVGGVCGQVNCVRGALCLVPDSTATAGTCRSVCNLDGGAPNCGAKACGPLTGAPDFGLCPL